MCVCGTEKDEGLTWPMLSCFKCNQPYHQKCIPNLRNLATLLVGDPFFHFECNQCNEGKKFLVQKISSTIRERLQLVIFNLIHTNAGHKLTDGSMVFQKNIIYEGLEKNWFYMTGHAAIAGERGSIMTTLSQQLTKRVEGLMSLPEHPLPMCTFDGSIKKGNVTRVPVFDVAEDGSIQNANSTVVGGVAGFGSDLYYELSSKTSKRKAPEASSADGASKVPKIRVKGSAKTSVTPPPPVPANASTAELLSHIESLHAHYQQQLEAVDESKRGAEDVSVTSLPTPAWKIITGPTTDVAVLESVLKERDEALHLAEQARDLAEAAFAKSALLEKQLAELTGGSQ
ncbi:hypothetical protein HDU79_008182 [Rhizoclosmatium sp. JEL0117]|nr:hypothetical protein HDU79_008182 [Rhizoclosmatium sp. JEL0117]